MADSARGSPADESSSSGNRPRSGVRSATTGDPTAARCTPKRGMPESSPLGAQHRRTRSRSALARHSANAAIASASAIGLRANASSISSWVPSAIAARSFAFSNLSRSVAATFIKAAALPIRCSNFRWNSSTVPRNKSCVCFTVRFSSRQAARTRSTSDALTKTSDAFAKAAMQSGRLNELPL